MSHPLHQLIGDNRHRIVDLFVIKVRHGEESPADRLTDQQVADHLTEYLGEMASALQSGDTTSVRACAAARLHGSQRWYLGGYDLKSVIREYDILRSAIFEIMAEAGETRTFVELNEVGHFLNEGIADAAAQFAAKAMQEVEAARTKAEHAAAAREELLAVVSHDLRNPLGVLLTGALMLEEDLQTGDLNEKKRAIQKYVRTAVRTSQRMVKLTADLLDLSRIKTGHIDLHETEVDVETLIADAIADSLPLAEQRSVKLVAVGPKNGAVRCDRDRVGQVFANLIENAIKFSPQGGTVTVRGFAADCRFEIKDEAGGIAPEHLTMLFDRFWQAPERTRGGTGLGLAIAKGIVESHGGRIGVESTLGVGSTFHFTLPRRSA